MQLARNALYLPGRVAGHTDQFLEDTGSSMSLLAGKVWTDWGRPRTELERHWGCLCSVEGNALDCQGQAHLTVILTERAVVWQIRE